MTPPVVHPGVMEWERQRQNLPPFFSSLREMPADWYLVMNFCLKAANDPVYLAALIEETPKAAEAQPVPPKPKKSLPVSIDAVMDLHARLLQEYQQ